MANDIDLKFLIQIVADTLNADRSSIRLKAIKTGRFNLSWIVDGWKEPLIVRVSPEQNGERMLFYEHRMILQGPSILKIVDQNTDVPVPKILSLTEKDQVIRRDWLLMTRLPGTPMSHAIIEEKSLSRIYQEIGSALQKIHKVTRDNFGYLGEHAPMEGQRSWPEAFRAMWNALIDDILRIKGYSLEEAAAMKRLIESFEKNIPDLKSSCLLHMDLWQENILISKDQKLSGIVDWDNAIWGDPDLDLTICQYYGLACRSFFEGYSDHSFQAQAKDPIKKLYLLYNIQKYIFINRARRGANKIADNYKKQCLRIARTLFE